MYILDQAIEVLNVNDSLVWTRHTKQKSINAGTKTIEYVSESIKATLGNVAMAYIDVTHYETYTEVVLLDETGDGIVRQTIEHKDHIDPEKIIDVVRAAVLHQGERINDLYKGGL